MPAHDEATAEAAGPSSTDHRLRSLDLMLCGYPVVGVYKYFPYEVPHNVKEAATILREKNAIPSGPHAFVVADDKAGVTEKAFDGYTFLAAYRDGKHKAVLMDMAGSVLHEWYVAFSDVWLDAPRIIEQAEDAAIHWHGSHLFPNGDFLFNFESGNFPYGGGSVKIDKDSNILWKPERNTHHDLDVVEDGTIFVAAHNYKNGSIAGLNNTKQPFIECRTEGVTRRDCIARNLRARRPKEIELQESVAAEIRLG
jgi:hypothetical protein